MLTFLQYLTKGHCSLSSPRGPWPEKGWRPLFARLLFLRIVLLRSFVCRSCWSQEWYKTSCLLEATFSCWNCSASVHTISFRCVYESFSPWKNAGRSAGTTYNFTVWSDLCFTASLCLCQILFFKSATILLLPVHFLEE